MSDTTTTGKLIELAPDQPGTHRPPSGSWNFVRGVFSDQGEPSSSRILTFLLAIAVIVFLGGVFRHVCQIQDAAALGLWLVNLPLIIAALVGLMGTPYALNRASGSVSDIISALRRGKE